MAQSASVQSGQEIICTPCVSENLSVIASNFCVNCEEYLCTSCVKHHMKLGITKTHELVAITDRVVDAVQFKEAEERCLKHSGKVISMFCSLHEEAGCHECMSGCHEHCGEIIYIPDHAKANARSTDIQRVKEDIQNTRDRLDAFRLARQDDLDRLGTQRDSIMTSLNAIKQRLFDQLREIENISERTCQNKYTDAVNNIKCDMSACNDLSYTLGRMYDMITSTSKETLIFLQTLKAKRNVSAGIKLLDKISHKVGREQLTYTPDQRVEHVFDDIKAFGQINTALGIYKAKYIEKNDTSIVSDKEKSDVMMFGCAVLTDGRMVATDFSNNRLKVLNREYKTVFHVELAGSPCGVCEVGEGEAAVCIYNKCLVQFISFEPTVKPIRSFKTELKCQGIAFDGNQLYITATSNSVNQIRVYLPSGSLQRIIEDCDGKKLFSSINQIICCPYSAKLYVTDTKKGVIVIDKKGNLLNVIQDKDILQPTGLAPDGDGGIFVAGFKTDKVVHFGQDGSKVATILTNKTGLKEPLTVYFDNISSKLTATLAGSKYVHVYQMYEKTHSKHN